MPKGIHDDRYRNVVRLLVQRRQSLGLRQEDLAAMLDLRQWDISRFESGERRLDFVEFADVTRALGLDARDLIGAVPDRSK